MTSLGWPRKYGAAFIACALAWAVLCSPWILNGLTIPYDAKAHFHAQLQFLSNALHSGQSPFWTPNVFAGSPQIADPQSLIFSPAILIAYLDPEPSFATVDTYVFLLVGCAALAILLFFRDRGWHPIGGVIAALGFSFGASAAWRIQHIGQVQSFVLFAIALWLLARTLERRSARCGIATGVAVGLMLIEPNQVALLASYVLVGYVIARLCQDGEPLKKARKSMLPLAAAASTATVVMIVPLILTYMFLES